MSTRVRVGLVIAILVGTGLTTWRFLRGGHAPEGVIHASGTVEATDADLGFERPGRVAAIAVREGDAVAAGDPIATLERDEVEARVAEARSALAAAHALLAELRAGARPQEIEAARARVQAAQERLEDAARDRERSRRLFEGGAISREAFDKANTAHEVARAHLTEAGEALGLVQEGPRRETIRAQEARVSQAEAALQLALAEMARTELRAPFDGVVTERHREPGEIVAAGAPVITLVDLDARRVRIYVREDRLGAVRLGQPAEITSDTYPDRRFRGEVSFIGSEAEFTPRSVQTREDRVRLVFPVEVRVLQDPEGVLKPGLPADVRLDPGSGTGG